MNRVHLDLPLLLPLTLLALCPLVVVVAETLFLALALLEANRQLPPSPYRVEPLPVSCQNMRQLLRGGCSSDVFVNVLSHRNNLPPGTISVVDLFCSLVFRDLDVWLC